MSGALAFTVAVEPARVAPGRPVALVMSLRNPGSEPWLVNARFAVAPEDGDIRLVVTSNGQDLGLRYLVRLGPLVASHFVTLGPGEETTGRFDLSSAYALHLPGSYEIIAEYVSPGYPPELSGQHVFVGRVHAPVVQLLVE